MRKYFAKRFEQTYYQWMRKGWPYVYNNNHQKLRIWIELFPTEEIHDAGRFLKDNILDFERRYKKYQKRRSETQNDSQEEDYEPDPEEQERLALMHEAYQQRKSKDAEEASSQESDPDSEDREYAERVAKRPALQMQEQVTNVNKSEYIKDYEKKNQEEMT